MELDKILNHFQSSWNTVAAADLLMDPNPKELICSTDKAYELTPYPIRVVNVLAIVSNGRAKNIYLKDPVRPVQGGEAKSMLTFEKDGVNFDQLLRKIQRGGEHLLRISKSTAINIYHYQLAEQEVFYIKDKFKNEANSDIQQVQLGSLFDKNLYQKRLFEIDKLKEHLRNALANIEKGKALQKKIEEMGLSD